MASVATSSHLPSLSEPHAREEVALELEATLRELIALSLTGKQLHWAVFGTNFRAVHLHLDELVASWRELADTVAERAVALGYVPDGQAPSIVASSQIPPVEHGPIRDEDVVRELVDRVAQVTEQIRPRIDKLDELDLVSQDVLIEVVRALEMQQWMLRAQLSDHK